jgi:hypothetical protein
MGVLSVVPDLLRREVRIGYLSLPTAEKTRIKSAPLARAQLCKEVSGISRVSGW